ncbi:MAG TPA: hypothetical protein VL354_13330 [Spirochaetia bacterium]|nr:hypothetical protein [Spirochaetia bacterium]
MTKTCASCFSLLLSTGGKNLSDYLESLDAPSALLDHEQTIVFANNRFRAMVIDHNSSGLRVGEALDCMYAATLGRCGDSVACLLCKIKRSVEHTLLTGEGLCRVPISYPHKTDSRRTFLIATERVGTKVLLLLESQP